MVEVVAALPAGGVGKAPEKLVSAEAQMAFRAGSTAAKSRWHSLNSSAKSTLQAKLACGQRTRNHKVAVRA